MNFILAAQEGMGVQDALHRPQASKLHILLFHTRNASFLSLGNLGYGQGELPLSALSHPSCRSGRAHQLRTGEEIKVDVRSRRA